MAPKVNPVNLIKYAAMFYILSIFLAVIIILFYLYMLHYIGKLEATGCVCSEDWKRDFIKWYFIFLIVMYFIPSLLLIVFPKLLTVLKYTNILAFIITAISVFVIYQYIRELKEKKCACSKGDARTALEIYNYIMIFIFIIILISSTYSLLFIRK